MAGYRNGFIRFDTPRDAYYPGQMVSGSVVVELDQPLTLSVLYVNFLGEATVDWKEKESEEHHGVKRYRDVDYMGREEYFNITQVLAGGNAPLNLPPGSHTYKFSYLIPLGVPSSFSGDRGGITYCVKANLELRGQTVMKQELKKYFEVIAPFDLNLGSPKLKEPIDFEFEEVYNCGCFCSSEPVSIRLRVPVSGYCPGQVIPVAVEISNDSSVEVRKIIFQILTKERYRTQRPISEYIPPEQILATVTKGAVMSGTKKNFTVEVQVPDMIAPNLENCEIIDVGYFFRTIIKLSGCNDDLEDESEICLGLAPLHETIDGEYIHPLSHSLPIGPIPNIPLPNTDEHNRQIETHQQSAYPSGLQFPNTNGPPGFPNVQSGYPNGPPFSNQSNSSYFVQVQEQHYSSTDPSKNYNIGFTMTSSPGAQGAQMLGNFPGQNWGPPPFHNSDLRIHLPPPMTIIKLSGCNDDLEDESEICLGLAPLHETIDGEYIHPLSHSLPIGPIPNIPLPNTDEHNRQIETHQQSAYPSGLQFPNTNGPPGFPNVQSGYPNGPPFSNQSNSSYFVQVQEQHYSSTDPSKNYNIGFTMTSSPGAQGAQMLGNFPGQNWGPPPFHNSDLRIHLPPPMVNVNIPSAPPPSS